MILSFTALESQPYGGARSGLRMYYVACDRDRACDRGFADILDQDVLIDGRICRVLSVERHLVPTIRKGATIGLLVDEAFA